MSGRIPDEKIREVLERAEIQEVVSSYVALKRSGANWQGLCPFHAEKTPSFNVNPPRQIYHCFGCGVGGDAISFVQRIEGLSFPDAVRRLAERYGIEIAEEQLTPEQEVQRQRHAQLLRINEVAAEFYQRILMDRDDERGRPARAYLKSRGYGRETAERFQLGYAPEGWEALTKHLAEKGFDEELIRQLGLTRPGKEGRGDYDLFRKRLIFPILSPRGKVAAFGARVLDQSLPKYINSPESPVYRKSATLYGFFQAREEIRRRGEAVVVEGYFDVMALHRAGFTQAVATCGTALTQEHGRLLKRFAPKVVLLFDQDAAGRQATFRAMEALLPEGMEVMATTLPEGEDPDSLLAAEGPERFRARLKQARPVFEIFMDERLAAHGDSVQGRARAAEEIVGRFFLIPSEIERALYRKALSDKTGLSPDLLRGKPESGSAAKSKPQERAPVEAAPPPVPPVPGTMPRRPRPSAGRLESTAASQALVRYVLDSGEVRQRVLAEGVENLVAEPPLRHLLEKILNLAATDGKIPGEQLTEILEPEELRLLSSIRFPARDVFGEDLDGLFSECRAAVERGSIRQRRRALMQDIHEAQRAGDQQAIARLTLELQKMRRLGSGKIE